MSLALYTNVSDVAVTLFYGFRELAAALSALIAYKAKRLVRKKHSSLITKIILGL